MVDGVWERASRAVAGPGVRLDEDDICSSFVVSAIEGKLEGSLLLTHLGKQC